MMKLRINPIVAEDLKNIKEYIAEDNEEMAVKTIQEIYARIENIQQFPYMGADLAKRVSFRMDYKYVICGNYVVLYKIGKEYVEIYRVVNRYQDITKIFLWCEENCITIDLDENGKSADTSEAAMLAQGVC